jgi:hypothetical protein
MESWLEDASYELEWFEQGIRWRQEELLSLLEEEFGLELWFEAMPCR